MPGRDATEWVAGAFLLVNAGSLVHVARRGCPLDPAYMPRADQDSEAFSSLSSPRSRVGTPGFHDERQGQRHSETRWQTRPASQARVRIAARKSALEGC